MLGGPSVGRQARCERETAGTSPCPHSRWEARTWTRQTPEGALLPTPCLLKVAGAELPRGGLLVTSLTQQNPVEEARPCGRKKCPIYLCS